jgi:hypothetical protein
MCRSVQACCILAAAVLAISCSGKKGGGDDLLVTELVEKPFLPGKDGDIPGGFSVGLPRRTGSLSSFILPTGHKEGLLYDLSWRKPVAGASLSLKPLTFAAFRAKKEIWVDWNRDRRFAPEEKQISLGTSNGKVFYQPTGAPSGRDFEGVLFGYAGGEDHQKAPLRSNWIFVSPATVLEGRFRLGGKDVIVRLVDGNLDSELRPKNGLMDFGDYIAIDYNLDGHVVMAQEAENWDKNEMVSLGTMHFFPNGKYYVLRLSTDRKKLTLIPDPTPTGKIHLDLDVQGLVSMSQGPEFQALPPINGNLILRAGQYELGGLTYRVKDAKGNRWRISLQQLEQRYLTVTPERTPTITSGPPYSISCQASAEQGGQVVYLWLFDGSRNVVDLVDGLDSPLHMAKCSITDKSGKVVYQQEMRRYGSNYIAFWKPKGAKGLFKVQIHWDLPLWGDLETSTRIKL